MTRVVFSFDDARFDSYRAIRIAEDYGIRSTLNITTAYVDGTIDESRRPSILPPMRIDKIISYFIFNKRFN